MILSEIKNYLKERQQASLSDISLHFNSDSGAVRGMLEVWLRKGKVRKCLANASCGSSCGKCDTDTTEIYQWIESDARQAPHSGLISTVISSEPCGLR